MRIDVESIAELAWRAREFASKMPARLRERRAHRALMKSRADIYEDLGNAVKNASGTSASGWTLLGQLEDWRDRAAGRKQPIAHIFAVWSERMRETGLFSTAIEGTVPQMETVSIATSEHIGQIGTGLIELAEDVKRLMGLEKTVMGMVREIALPFMAILAAILFFSIIYTPEIAAFVPLAKMPPATRGFYYFGQWIPTWWPLVLALGVGIYKTIDWSMENWTGWLRDRLDTFPLSPYPYYRDYTSARLLVALNRRMSQGDTIARALEQIGEQSPEYLKVHCDRAIANIEAALGMHEVLDTGLFNEHLMDRIADYIRQGDFTSAIGKLAGHSFAKVEESILANMRTVKGLSTLLLYVVIIAFIGLVINTIVASSSGFRF